MRLARSSWLLPVLPHTADARPGPAGTRGLSGIKAKHKRLLKKPHKHQVCYKGEGACSLKHFFALCTVFAQKGHIICLRYKSFPRNSPHQPLPSLWISSSCFWRIKLLCNALKNPVWAGTSSIQLTSSSTGLALFLLKLHLYNAFMWSC